MSEDQHNYGWVLEKAVCDEYTYAVKLVDGTMFEFDHCELGGGWVTFHINGDTEPMREAAGAPSRFCLGRGLCVPLD